MGNNKHIWDLLRANVSLFPNWRRWPWQFCCLPANTEQRRACCLLSVCVSPELNVPPRGRQLIPTLFLTGPQKYEMTPQVVWGLWEPFWRPAGKFFFSSQKEALAKEGAGVGGLELFGHIWPSHCAAGPDECNPVPGHSTAPSRQHTTAHSQAESYPSRAFKPSRPRAKHIISRPASQKWLMLQRGWIKLFWGRFRDFLLKRLPKPLPKLITSSPSLMPTISTRCAFSYIAIWMRKPCDK